MPTAPVANDDTLTFQEGGTIQVQVDDLIANDTDADGDSLTVTAVRGDIGAPVFGLQDRYVEVQLPTDYYGTFRMMYTVFDGTQYDEGVVEVTVENINDAPLGSENGQAFTVQAGTTLTVEDDRGILRAVPNANTYTEAGIPIDGDDFTAVLDSGPTNGTLDLNPEGGFTYTPNTGFTGEDTFTYFIDDGTTQSASAYTATITVPTNTTNQAPVATDDSFTDAEDPTPNTQLSVAEILSNDSDPDGGPEPIYIDRVYGAYGGEVSLEDANIFFRPDPDFDGTASFVYILSDGVQEDQGIVTIDYTPVNDAPVANDEPEPFLDRYYAYQGSTLDVVATEGLLFNDTDADGDELSAVLSEGPKNGTLSLNADGSFTYTPDAGFTGQDTFYYAASDGTASSADAKVVINVSDAGTDGGNGTSLPPRDKGGSGSGEKLTGDGTANRIDGAGGNDTISGRGGDDTLIGGSGADEIRGDDGVDDISGGSGNDILEGGAGADMLYGNAGNDTASYAGSSVGVSIKLWDGSGRFGDAEGDTLANIENVIGSSGRDFIVGTSSANLLEGGAKYDILRGGSGDDELAGNSGWDKLVGGGGADTLDGGLGRDLADYSDSASAVTVRLWDESGSRGDAEGDVLISIERVEGSDYADLLVGDTGDNELSGGAGADAIYGGGGSDLLESRSGWDNLNGGAGNDTLDGGFGNDVLTGGAGPDVFVFNENFGEDRIEDFDPSVAGEAIDFSGVAEFTDFADLETNHMSDSADGVVIDDGAGNSVTLAGVTTADLDSGDFIF